MSKWLINKFVKALNNALQQQRGTRAQAKFSLNVVRREDFLGITLVYDEIGYRTHVILTRSTQRQAITTELVLDTYKVFYQEMVNVCVLTIGTATNPDVRTLLMRGWEGLIRDRAEQIREQTIQRIMPGLSEFLEAFPTREGSQEEFNWNIRGTDPQADG